jgi:hypothetical protein
MRFHSSRIAGLPNIMQTPYPMDKTYSAYITISNKVESLYAATHPENVHECPQPHVPLMYKEGLEADDFKLGPDDGTKAGL